MITVKVEDERITMNEPVNPDRDYYLRIGRRTLYGRMHGQNITEEILKLRVQLPSLLTPEALSAGVELIEAPPVELLTIRDVYDQLNGGGTK